MKMWFLSTHVIILFFVDHCIAIVNKLSHTKYDVVWMSNGDIIKMKRELTSALLNKVGTYVYKMMVIIL